jgi:hypothetical protein
MGYFETALAIFLLFFIPIIILTAVIGAFRIKERIAKWQFIDIGFFKRTRRFFDNDERIRPVYIKVRFWTRLYTICLFMALFCFYIWFFSTYIDYLFASALLFILSVIFYLLRKKRINEFITLADELHIKSLSDKKAIANAKLCMMDRRFPFVVASAIFFVVLSVSEFANENTSLGIGYALIALMNIGWIIYYKYKGKKQ